MYNWVLLIYSCEQPENMNTGCNHNTQKSGEALDACPRFPNPYSSMGRRSQPVHHWLLARVCRAWCLCGAPGGCPGRCPRCLDRHARWQALQSQQLFPPGPQQPYLNIKTKLLFAESFKLLPSKWKAVFRETESRRSFGGSFSPAPLSLPQQNHRAKHKPSASNVA